MTAVVPQTPWQERYLALRERLLAEYRAIPPGTPVRLAKQTSNLFRPRDASAAPGLDVAAFDGVLHVDPVTRTAEVLGMTTYEHLVDATLPYGLMPLCVPQLRTITLGGAVTGLGIESASFRNGTPHESVLEMDILTGDGEILTVTGAAVDPHRDLLYGFPNSYGSLGYALRLKIELEPTKPYVQLRHVRFATASAMAEAFSDIARDRVFEDLRVDFLDGTVFAPDEQYLTIGSMVDELPSGMT
ncbi:MAG: FAD-binding oxidoreductase, partial [Candidatus Nanopelagicales bacterium]